MSVPHRIFSALIVAVGLLWAVGARAESVQDFDVHLSVDDRAVLTVEESITYDFGTTEHHGIYRTIPYSYTRDSLHYATHITVVSVTDGDGHDQSFTTTRGGGALTLRIGDPNVFVTGQKTYAIVYRVEKAINWFNGEPEVYWNVTGNEWEVPISQANVYLSGMLFTADHTLCYTGFLGSQASDCVVEDSAEGALHVGASAPLPANEGLSVVARLPAGSILEPTPTERLFAIMRDNLGFFLPIPVLILLLWAYRRYGRDPKGRGTIIPEYEPPKGISPAMLGYIVDESIDTRDLTAAILQLAVTGNLKILYEQGKGLKHFGHSYRLQKRNGSVAALTQFEKELLAALFSSGDDVTLADLQKTFPRELGSLKGILQKEAQERHFFAHTPSGVRSAFFIVGAILAISGFTLLSSETYANGVGVFLSGLLILGFAKAMPKRSEAGVLTREHILGFKRYLTVAEKDRLAFHNAPKVKPEQFFTLLPFAIALAVEKEWAKQFAGITLEQPDWYAGQHWSTFNAYVFASAMSDFSHTSRAQVFHSPTQTAGGGGSGFGGGGFSGGGFGGGGGGSW